MPAVDAVRFVIDAHHQSKSVPVTWNAHHAQDCDVIFQLSRRFTIVNAIFAALFCVICDALLKLQANILTVQVQVADITTLELLLKLLLLILTGDVEPATLLNIPALKLV